MNPSDISRWQGSVNSWLGQGVATGVDGSPVDNTILCDTTGLVAGYYDFVVTLSGTGPHEYCLIQHRNIINDDSLFVWWTVWGTYTVNSIFINNWKIVANERLRVVVENNSNDILMANIHWTIRA